MSSVHNVQIAADQIRVGQTDGVRITPGENCVLTVDGVNVTSPVQISSGQAVTWQGHGPLPQPFRLVASKDRMTVNLIIDSDCHYKWEADLLPDESGYVVNCVQKKDPARPLTVTDIIDEFKKQRFQANINWLALENAVNSKTSNPVPIAEGEPVTEGKNGWVETHFSTEEEVSFTRLGDRLNYREKRRIPVIRTGELMATIHPPTNGKAGKDVWGNLIPPKPVHPVNCRFKQNVREMNGNVYAAITGRPSMTRGVRPILDVIPAYTVAGDVDLETGHVHFEGDVIVHGNVLETMKVTAGQRIFVYGGVYNAELVAGGSVDVEGTVRKSKVYAGQRGVLAQKLERPLQQFYKQASAAERSRHMLEEQAQKQRKVVPTAELLNRLLLDHYPDVLKEGKRVLNIIQQFKGHLPEELAPLKEILARFIHESSLRFNFATWQGVLQETDQCLREKLAACLQHETLTLQTADVSELHVDGDVVFTGKGSTHSHIRAGKRIVFMQANASCRGGTLRAGDAIIAAHLGSLTGNKTTCRAGNRISAKSVQHCDIQIAGAVRYVEEMEEIEFYRDGEHTLTRNRREAM